jgi:hypothetical protein
MICYNFSYNTLFTLTNNLVQNNQMFVSFTDEFMNLDNLSVQQFFRLQSI